MKNRYVDDEYTNDSLNEEYYQNPRLTPDPPKRAHRVTPHRYNLRDANYMF